MHSSHLLSLITLLQHANENEEQLQIGQSFPQKSLLVCQPLSSKAITIIPLVKLGKLGIGRGAARGRLSPHTGRSSVQYTVCPRITAAAQSTSMPNGTHSDQSDSIQVHSPTRLRLRNTIIKNTLSVRLVGLSMTATVCSDQRGELQRGTPKVRTVTFYNILWTNKCIRWSSELCNIHGGVAVEIQTS